VTSSTSSLREELGGEHDVGRERPLERVAYVVELRKNQVDPRLAVHDVLRAQVSSVHPPRKTLSLANSCDRWVFVLYIAEMGVSVARGRMKEVMSGR